MSICEGGVEVFTWFEATFSGQAASFDRWKSAHEAALTVASGCS